MVNFLIRCGIPITNAWTENQITECFRSVTQRHDQAVKVVPVQVIEKRGDQ